MFHLTEIIVTIGCGCILPIVVVWLIVRRRINETNARTQIALAAIEKNPDMDIEELLKKVSNKGKPGFSTTFKELNLMIYNGFRLVFNISTDTL